MHLLPGPLISAIAEGERIEISFGPGCMFRQHVLGIYGGFHDAHQCEQNLHTADANHAVLGNSAVLATCLRARTLILEPIWDQEIYAVDGRKDDIR